MCIQVNHNISHHGFGVGDQVKRAQTRGSFRASKCICHESCVNKLMIYETFTRAFRKKIMPKYRSTIAFCVIKSVRSLQLRFEFCRRHLS